MGIPYDMSEPNANNTEIISPPLPYGPMPKEKISGNVLQMPQRKII